MEGRSRPEWCRPPRSKGAWEQRAVCPFGVAEEAVTPVEKSGELLDIETGGHITRGEAVSEAVICLPLGCHSSICTENTEIASV